MGTRGAIARLESKELGTWRGRYHHWDSYPDGLGQALYELYQAKFRGRVERMLELLIDQHPAGWSTIVGANWRLKPGYVEDLSKRTERPKCYCHGDRHEEPWEVDQTSVGSGVGWAYVFEGTQMHVLASVCRDGEKMIGMFGFGDEKAVWREHAVIDLDGPQPDWENVACGPNLEWCTHYARHHFPELAGDRRYRNVDTNEYLERTPFELWSAYGVEIAGRRYWLGTSGHSEGKRWVNELEDMETGATMQRAIWQMEPKKKPLVGVKPLYAPVRGSDENKEGV